MNPYTALPFTPRYFELFRKRIQLPVWEYQEKFLDLLNKHQGCDSTEKWLSKLLCFSLIALIFGIKYFLLF